MNGTLSWVQISRIAPATFLAIVSLGGCFLDQDQKSNFDDPAVVICEQIAKAKIPKNATYKRASATIKGRTVELSYSVAILTTKPKDESIKCEYKKAQDAKSFIVQPLEEATEEPWQAACVKNGIEFNDASEAERQKKIQELTNRGLDELQKAIDEVKKCKIYITQKMLKLGRELIIAEKTGLHPINSDDTQLK